MAGLDGLRGAAVVAVLLFHGSHLRGGYLGVDLFFVLSGFLITSLLLAEGGGSGHVGLAHFWERRARRLLPALGLMLVGVGAYAKFAAKPAELHRIRMDGLATLFYASNWHDIFGKTDYAALFASPSPLEHTWSLAIEEQFYVVWPLVFVVLLYLARRRQRDAPGRVLARLSLVLASGLGMLTFSLSLLLVHVAGWNRTYYGTDTRAFAILAGAAVASLRVRNGPVREGVQRRLVEVAGVAGAVVLGVCWLTMGFDSAVTRSGGLLVCSLAGAMVVAAISHPTRGPLARVASFAPLRWLGLISYGLYLYHWPIIVWLTADRVHLRGWPLFGVQMVVTVAVAVLSYFLVEQPIRQGSGWPKLANVLVPASGLATISVLLIASTATTKSTLEFRSATTSMAQASAAARKNHSGTIMVIGDSLGWALLLDGFLEFTTTPKTTFLLGARIGCSYPSPDYYRASDGSTTSEDAETCNQGWLRAAVHYKPDYVLFISRGLSIAEYHHDGRYLDACSPAFVDWTTKLFSDDAAAFARTGAKFVLVTSAPPDREMPKSQHEDYIRVTHCGNNVLRNVAKTHTDTVELIDLEAHLCTAKGVCRHTQDGVTLRADGLHYVKDGARVITPWLLTQMGIHSTPK